MLTLVKALSTLIVAATLVAPSFNYKLPQSSDDVVRPQAEMPTSIAVTSAGDIIIGEAASRSIFRLSKDGSYRGRSTSRGNLNVSDLRASANGDVRYSSATAGEVGHASRPALTVRCLRLNATCYDRKFPEALGEIDDFAVNDHGDVGAYNASGNRFARSCGRRYIVQSFGKGYTPDGVVAMPDGSFWILGSTAAFDSGKRTQPELLARIDSSCRVQVRRLPMKVEAAYLLPLNNGASLATVTNDERIEINYLGRFDSAPREIAHLTAGIRIESDGMHLLFCSNMNSTEIVSVDSQGNVKRLSLPSMRDKFVTTFYASPTQLIFGTTAGEIIAVPNRFTPNR